jgi:pimeloyl-ACP methyl ester carboxylesterase
LRTPGSPGLFYRDEGRGEPVLLITGWTISSAVFDPVARLYTPHVRCIAYDHRGSGRSAPWLAPVSMAMLAADAARVLDTCDVRHAHVVGVSMGAMVALELAVRMPDRVKSLVLVGGGAGGPQTTIPSATGAARTMSELVIDSVRRGRPWPAAALFSKRFRDEHPERVAELVPAFGMHRAPPWTAWWQTLATSCFARHESLGRVRAPTLVLHGDEDAMSPLENAMTLARGIPGARLHIERGAGHAVPLERADACAALLLDWFGDHAGSVPVTRGGWGRATERVTRPFALHAGALRNTRQAAPAVLRRLGF